MPTIKEIENNRFMSDKEKEVAILNLIVLQDLVKNPLFGNKF